MATEKKTLFISYCWSDGSEYAEALQAQLVDYFHVKRDKTQLTASDDIFSFMAEIALQDYVLIVLTPNYVKSTNCMLEVAYLLEQPDWISRVVVLVIDDSIYSTERKLEILTYWKLKMQQCAAQKEVAEVGTSILAEELEFLELINQGLESFLSGISRINNPSQIAIVNEMARKTRADSVPERDREILGDQEKRIADFIRRHGNATLSDISSELDISKAYASRLLMSLVDKKMVEISQGVEASGKHIRKRSQYSIHDDSSDLISKNA